MSAYICDPEHHKALAAWAASRPAPKYPGDCTQRVNPVYLRDETAKQLDPYDVEAVASFFANTLYQENIRSVWARYPDEKWESLPGPSVKPDSLTVTYTEAKRNWYLKPIDILKMCDGLEYQSCETSDWRETLAYNLLTRIRHAAIAELPGYEEAPWEYTGRARTSPVVA
jgi:hypothetical protein